MARSGYYAWRQRQEAPGKRAAENARLTAEIEAVFQEHRGFYGSPRIHQELRAAGHPIGRHRVARLMRCAQLKARTRKPFRPCSKGGVPHGLLCCLPSGTMAPPQGPVCELRRGGSERPCRTGNRQAQARSLPDRLAVQRVQPTAGRYRSLGSQAAGDAARRKSSRSENSNNPRGFKSHHT